MVHFFACSLLFFSLLNLLLLFLLTYTFTHKSRTEKSQSYMCQIRYKKDCKRTEFREDEIDRNDWIGTTVMLVQQQKSKTMLISAATAVAVCFLPNCHIPTHHSHHWSSSSFLRLQFELKEKPIVQCIILPVSTIEIFFVFIFCGAELLCSF